VKHPCSNIQFSLVPAGTSSLTSNRLSPIQLAGKDPEGSSSTKKHEKHRATLTWLEVKLTDKLPDRYV